MKKRLNELLALFALDDASAISEAFLERHNVSNEERKLLYEFVSLILRGYIFADQQTQEIVDIIGDSNRPEGLPDLVGSANQDLNRRMERNNQKQ